MPAQHESEQIPVPIFRMLGSDPVRQYDDQLGSVRQGVITLEPVYPHAGGDSTWINWFFRELVEGASMDFAYTQAGQENSFTWDAMAKGLSIQFPLIEKLRDEKKIKVETLAESGEWFRSHYKVTPATAVTINNDLPGSNRKTVWFNSRFFRANLLWEDSTLRFRDIHLFNEKFPSVYETQPATSNECSFFTLPIVDGYLWSVQNKLAGLRFKATKNGQTILLKGKNPVISDATPGKLHISWPLESFEGTLEMELDEQQIKITISGNRTINWYLELDTAGNVKLPFKNIGPKQLDAQFEGMDYALSAEKGSFSVPQNGSIFRLSPVMNSLVLKL
jgi:hypothetical protein